MDHFGWSRKKAVWIFTGIEMIGGLLCCFIPDFYNLVSTYAGDYFYCASALISVIVFAYIFGIRKIRDYNNSVSDVKVGGYVDVLLKFVAMPLLAVVVIMMFI